MAALNFPTGPSANQIYTDSSGRSFRYDSTYGAWFGLNSKAGLALLIDAQYDGGSATATPTLSYAGQQQSESPANENAKSVFLDAIQTLANKVLRKSTLTDVSVSGSPHEAVYTITDGASVRLDPKNGPIQKWTLGANRTAADGLEEGDSMTLFVADGSAFTLTITGVIYVGGTTPTIATSGFSIFELFKVSGQLYLSYVGDVTQ